MTAGVKAFATTEPSSNTTPSDDFWNACYDVSSTTASQNACDSAAVSDFDAVRAGEGIGPMTLPTGFASMPPAEQLLVISNLERVDRGLTPAAGLVSSLNSLAQQGAAADDDPAFPNPFRGTAGGSNWAAAGNSTLLDDFEWMYDDGIGSGNIDCTTTDTSGCWGHRGCQIACVSRWVGQSEKDSN